MNQMNKSQLDEKLKEMAQHPAKVPSQVKRRIEDTLSALPNRKGISRKMKAFYSATAAVLLAGCVIGTGFISPTMASALKQIPGVQSVFNYAGDIGLKAADKKGILTEVGHSITAKGITFTISEIMYDGSRISIGFIQESAEGIAELRDVDFYVNGKKLNTGWGRTGNSVDDQTYAGVINLMPDVDLPDRFELNIKVNKIGDQTGNWHYSMPVTKLQEGVKSFIPMASRQDKGIEITAKRVLFTPSTTEVHLEWKKPAGGKYIEFQLLTNDGRIVQPLSGSSTGEGDGQRETIQWHARYAPMDQIPASLKLRPIIYENANEPLEDVIVPMEHLPAKDRPITIHQGEAGQLEIHRIEFNEDKTIVHYQVKNAVDPHAQSNPLWIQDESGVRHIDLRKSAVLIDPENYIFVRDYPAMDSNQKLSFVSRKLAKPTVLSELEVTIPLQK
jgi:hypothetical protein